MNDQKKIDGMQFLATCALGTEKSVAFELKQIGFRILQSQKGRVLFWAGIKDIPKVNIWSRCADRILMKVNEFEASSFDQLFEGIYQIPWEQWIPKDGTVILSKAKTKRSTLTSIPAIQSVSQKAIVNRIQDHYHIQSLSEDGPRFPVWIYLSENKALIAMDTTGEGLHKRGYRLASSKAPLRETIASSLLSISRWNPRIALIDPFCGGGTIPIEAGMIALNIAPGIRRSFVSEGWPIFSAQDWADERRQAKSQIQLRDMSIRIMGSDTDGQALTMAQENARRAGVVDLIKWEKLPMEQLRSEWEYGYVIANPPYGERMTSPDHAQKLIMQMRHFSKNLPTWSFFFLSPEEGFPSLFQRKADKAATIQNSTVTTQFFSFWGPKPPKGFSKEHL